MNTSPITEFFVEFIGVSDAFRRGFEEGNAKGKEVKCLQFSSEAQCARMLNFLFLQRLQKQQLTEQLYRTHIGYLLGLLNGCTFRLKEDDDAAQPATNNRYSATREQTLSTKGTIEDKKHR